MIFTNEVEVVHFRFDLQLVVNQELLDLLESKEDGEAAL
jgi:hypothetical protein